MAGSAMSAEIQWKRSRVAASAPDHTDTENSMMLPAAKPATASARTSSRSTGSRVSSSAGSITVLT